MIWSTFHVGPGLLLGAVLVSGCATSPAAPPAGSSSSPGDAARREARGAAPSESTAAVAPSPAPRCAAFARPGVLRREPLARAVQGGLGRWLQGVDVEPARKAGKFHGWRIQRLHPADPCYRDVDLRPGDVVVRVNGHAIERPEQANAVFLDLAARPTLRVDYFRGEQPLSITFVVGD